MFVIFYVLYCHICATVKHMVLLAMIIHDTYTLNHKHLGRAYNKLN